MKIRNSNGSQMAEFPAALCVLIVVVFFVLIDLSTVLVGVNNLHNAARIAASDAARAPSFIEATTKAKNAVGNIIGNVPVRSISVIVLEVPVQVGGKDSSGNPLQTTQILPGPKPIIDTTSYQYQVQVTVTGEVSPLANLSGIASFANIPGVTGPMVVAAKYSSLFENPIALGN